VGAPWPPNSKAGLKVKRVLDEANVQHKLDLSLSQLEDKARVSRPTARKWRDAYAEHELDDESQPSIDSGSQAPGEGVAPDDSGAEGHDFHEQFDTSGEDTVSETTNDEVEDAADEADDEGADQDEEPERWELVI
jgi:cobalamin biosynthesis protein CobT